MNTHPTPAGWHVIARCRDAAGRDLVFGATFSPNQWATWQEHHGYRGHVRYYATWQAACVAWAELIACDSDTWDPLPGPTDEALAACEAAF